MCVVVITGNMYATQACMSTARACQRVMYNIGWMCMSPGPYTLVTFRRIRNQDQHTRDVATTSSVDARPGHWRTYHRAFVE